MYEDYKIKHIGKNCFQSQSHTLKKKKSQELTVDLTTLILLQNEVYLLEMFFLTKGNHFQETKSR